MTILAYLIYIVVLLPLSLIPLPVLYLISDFFGLIIFRMIGYRKAVILKNLRLSFPEKPEQEIQLIRRKFERNFTDIFIAENIKGLSPFVFPLKRMMSFSNLEVLEKLYVEKKGIILSSGHFGNWELLAHLGIHPSFKHRLIGIYKVQSPIADTLVKIARTKSGAGMIPMEDVMRSFSANPEELKAYIFIGDQSPAAPKTAHWMNFLHQDTGVVNGTEKTAKIFDYAVVYVEIVRRKRGRYHISYSLVTDKPKETAKGEITERATQMLEESILKHPDNWLWSHRRWKHSRPEQK